MLSNTQTTFGATAHPARWCNPNCGLAPCHVRIESPRHLPGIPRVSLLGPDCACWLSAMDSVQRGRSTHSLHEASMPRSQTAPCRQRACHPPGHRGASVSGLSVPHQRGQPAGTDRQARGEQQTTHVHNNANGISHAELIPQCMSGIWFLPAQLYVYGRTVTLQCRLQPYPRLQRHSMSRCAKSSARPSQGTCCGVRVNANANVNGVCPLCVRACEQASAMDVSICRYQASPSECPGGTAAPKRRLL